MISQPLESRTCRPSARSQFEMEYGGGKCDDFREIQVMVALTPEVVFPGQRAIWRNWSTRN